jgi:hypothetical protein
MSHRPIASIKADLKALRAEMRAAGIKKTSCFSGGLDREVYRMNARRFALETELESATKHLTEA